MSSFVIYIIGYVIFVIGVAIAAHLIGVPTEWIGIGAIILIGIGIFSAATKTRRED